MKQIYFSPKCEESLLKAETILCASSYNGSGFDQYDIEDYSVFNL